MSVRNVIQRGYGVGGSISAVVLRGYFAEAAAGAVTTDTHDGGYPWEWETADEIRKRIRQVEKAQEQSRRKRKEADKKLADELDRAYRRIVLNEPEIAAEVAEAVTMASPKAIKGTIGEDRLPTIDWRGLSNLLAASDAMLAALERDRQIAMREEDDIEILLLAVA